MDAPNTGSAGCAVPVGIKRTIAVPIVFLLVTSTVQAEDAKPKKRVKLPGMVIDLEKRCVDLEATVCIDKGFLELIACTKGSKEHESIVAVSARPMHIHVGLLAIGARHGHPAMRKTVDEKKMHWVNVLPRGDSIGVFFVIKNGNGKLVEHPVSTFVMPANSKGATRQGKPHGAERGRTFPPAFLFAGSQDRTNPKGKREYLADLSGHVISIATFGDELLCLPRIESRVNGALNWQVNPKHLPKVGTKITLRLRPTKAKKTGLKK